MFYLVVTAVAGLVGTVCGMSYSSDLTDEKWALSTHENRASELMLEHLTQQGSPGGLS